MDRDRAIESLRQLRLCLEARGVAHAGIFGSVACGDAQSASDFDIIVTPAGEMRLDLIDLGGVQSLLDESFGGLDLDLVVEPVRQTKLRDAIRRDRVNAF